MKDLVVVTDLVKRYPEGVLFGWLEVRGFLRRALD